MMARVPYWLRSRQGLRRKLCKHTKRGASFPDGGAGGYVCARCGVIVVTDMPRARWVSGESSDGV